MSTGIYISADNGKDGFRFPINPPELPFPKEADSEEYTIAGTGVISVPKPMKLEVFSFESYFPAMPTHYSETDFIAPNFYVAKINKWMKERAILRFIYVDGSFSINEQVKVESFEPLVQYGTDDISYSISFKKHVPFGFKKMKIVTPSSDKDKKVVAQETPKRETSKPVPQTYTLVKGDCLWKIAQKYTGKGTNYKELQSLNGIKDSQLRKLPIGLKVKLPTSWTVKK
ncbi:MAG: LysM peptidoglycan-binding domain-containing protein [Lysinibacillus sp.]